MPADKEIKLRFTRAEGGKLRVEGADPENARLIRQIMGSDGELTIDGDAIQLVDEKTGKPVKLESMWMTSAGRLADALASSKADAIGFSKVDQDRVRLLNVKAESLPVSALSQDTVWALGFANARAIGFTEQTGAVDTYLRCVRALLEGSDGAIRGLGNANPSDGVRLARRLWARTSSARVFEFPDEHYSALHRSCDRVLTEDSKTFSINAPGDIDRLANETLGFLRDPLPFESVYLGFGGGVPLPPELVQARFLDGSRPENLTQYRVLGYLVVDSGARLAVEFGYVITTNDNYLHPCVLYDSEEVGNTWSNSMTLAPWIIGASVRLINEHKILVEEKRLGLGHRMEADRIRKKYKHKGAFVPKPYYRLVLKDATIQDEGKRDDALGPPRTLSFRHDRESHDRYYVRRGPLPIDEKRASKLEKAGYRIWTLDRPGAEVLEQLARRGMPLKRADEWMAVLVRRISEQVIGDPRLPYVPAPRVPKTVEAVSSKLTGLGGS